MAYEVFLSHSSADAHWVGEISSLVQARGIGLYLFDHDHQPGSNVAAKLQAAIRRCDALIVLLTASGAASAYVQQEIGFALGDNKLVIPLVEASVGPDQLAMLHGLEYLKIDLQAPLPAYTTLLEVLHRLVEKQRQDQLVEEQRKGLSVARQRKEGQEAILTAVVLALVGVAVLAAVSQS